MKTAAAAAVTKPSPSSHLDLIVGLDTFLQAHLLLQVEAEFFQATEDAVMIRCLHTLVLSTAVCCAGEVRCFKDAKKIYNLYAIISHLAGHRNLNILCMSGKAVAH